SELGLANNAVLDAEVFFPGSTTGRRIGTTGNNSTYTLGPDADVHGGLFTIGGTYAGNGWSGTTVINQGTIAADVAGQTVTISPVTFVNTGTVAAVAGVVTIAPTSGAFTNSGTISVDAGRRVNITGAYTQDAAGRLLIKVSAPDDFSI